MTVEKFNLRKDNPKVTVTSYILEESPEFRVEIKRPAVIICPGGGYISCSDREAEPVAMMYLRKGFNAFVLRYTVSEDDKRTNVFRDALKDLGDSILLVRKNAQKWNIDIDKLILVGFSAGGHLCASMSSLWNEEELKNTCKVTGDELKVSAVILGYPLTSFEVMDNKLALIINKPGWMESFIAKANRALIGISVPTKEQQFMYSPINFISSDTVPTFIWHTNTDGLVFSEQSILYTLLLDRCGVKYELHIFNKGDHGLSLADDTIMRDENDICTHCQPWIDMSFNWLYDVIFRNPFSD